MNDTAKPLITTIIPTYRRPKLLRRAIRSALNQTYPHLQVCVYDNASGDETASVVAEMAKNDSRVKYHCHAENIGAFDNFLYGMEHLETPFFSFLSDDDLLLPEFYETTLSGFEEHPEAIFSTGATIHMDHQGNILSVPILAWKAGYYQAPEGLLTMLRHFTPVWTGILFRSEVIEEIGVLDREVGMNSDSDFTLRAAARFPFAISRRPGAILMGHPASASSQSCFHDTWPGWLKMIRNLTEDERIPLDVRIRSERMLTERLKRRIFRIGITSIMRKNFEDAYKSSEVLRERYHLNLKPFFLSSVATICRYCFLVYYFAVFLNKIRKFLRQKKCRHLQKQFGDYARLLEMS